jgi:hypothetical protein
MQMHGKNWGAVGAGTGVVREMALRKVTNALHLFRNGLRAVSVLDFVYIPNRLLSKLMI